MNLYWDIETCGPGHEGLAGLLSVTYAVDDRDPEVLSWFDFNLFEESVLDTDHLYELLADPAYRKVSHSTYDPRWIQEAGIEVVGDIVDTKVMAWTLNENTPLDIEWLAMRYAGMDMDKRLRRSGGNLYFESSDGVKTLLSDFPSLPWDHPYWLEMLEYNAGDVVGLRKVYTELKQRLDEAEWTDYWETEEVPYTPILVKMELQGLPVDLERVAALTPVVEADQVKYAAELLEEGGLPPSFNLNSQKQLVTYLFSRMATFTDALVYDEWTIGALKECISGGHEDCEPGFPGIGDPDHCVVNMLPEGFVIDKLGRDRVHGHWSVKGRNLKPTPPAVNKVTGEKGKLPSTSSPELLYMHGTDPWVLKLCTKYRKAEKLLNTYLHKFPTIARSDGMGQTRIYGQYNQTGTVTGRLSSSGPNMQNMPSRGERGKQVRSLFAFDEALSLWLVIGDYDQLEMRIMASLSHDKRLVQVFRDGEDPHAMLARAIWGDGIDVDAIPPGAACSYRDAAKTLNYAMGYGAGKKKVAQTLSLLGFPTTVEVAGGYLAEMERFYAGLFQWVARTKETAKRTGNVRTLGGRRRRLRAAFKDRANWKLVGYGERQAVNSIVQGTAADIIRRTMFAATAALPELRLLAQVHDELVFESRREQGPHVETLMELQHLAETAHGFDLQVPLVFEPTFGKSWAEKGGHELADFFADEMEEMLDA